MVIATPQPLYPREYPVPTEWNGGSAPDPVRTGAENFASIGIRYPDRPAHTKSLRVAKIIKYSILRYVELVLVYHICLVSRIWVGKPKVERQLRSPRRRRQDNVKIDVKSDRRA